jgi:hypothetical protein
MATAHRAFEGKTKTSLIAAIVTGEPKSMSLAQPRTPPALEHVVLKCLAKPGSCCGSVLSIGRIHSELPDRPKPTNAIDLPSGDKAACVKNSNGACSGAMIEETITGSGRGRRNPNAAALPPNPINVAPRSGGRK